ncbi:RICIN domain-containing protein [Paenibacillus prosopidis]|uniref:Ricin-type beta-trefoil lectin protein n=1 Tax=Paenibacillus prosopidis TaxID=630520 RepID=A0A368W332_9BACL|nr:RICIN domain-containing protein [Paenibacillus prosopidis]RCW48483.1 ricin-type beta-trefoil lectin protein [Paenibacillus prosopidis]
MYLFEKNSFPHRIVSGILCLVLAMTTFLTIGSQTAQAAISPLITPYKPQVVSTSANLSYTDSSGNTVTGTINHPGIAMSQTDLDNMRDHVRAGDEPWNTAFNAFAADSQSSKTPRIYYENTYIFKHIQGPWGFNDIYTDPANPKYYSNPSEYVGARANTDSETALMQAVMWYITGDVTYRTNAMKIIRSYSAAEDIVTHTNFRFAIMSYLLSAAAEILRYSDTLTLSEKWTDADTANLTHLMDIVAVTYNAHGMFMNQHQFGVMGTMGRAIFTNNLQLYDEAVEATTVNAAGNDGGRNGSIKHQMRWMTKNERTGEPLDPSDYHVQLVEMGRDQGHTYADIAGLSTLAQTINAQGTKVDPVTGARSTAANAVNAFNYLDDRLLEGTTYALKYHLGYEMLWTPAWANENSTIQYYDKINPWPGRGRFDPYLSVLYNYYKYIEGRDMTQEKYKYLAYAYETRMPEVAQKDYPLASLLYTPDTAKTDGLSNKITLGSITGLTATAAGANTIYLSWEGVPNALGYNIYRSTDPNGTFTKISSAPTAATVYRDTSLTPDTTYYYQVEVAGGSKSAVVSAATGGSSGTASVRFKNAATGLYIDGIGRTVNGSAAGQWSSSTSNNQRWIEEISGSYVRFKNVATGLYLDGMGLTTNGSIAGQWSSSTSNNQQWSVSIDGNNVRIRNRASGLYLDGVGRTTDGADLGQYGGGSSANQRWQIVN